MQHVPEERTPPAGDFMGGTSLDARAGSLHFTGSPEEATSATLRVQLGRVAAAGRGRLAELIDDAIERDLHAHRAPPPGIGASRDADSTLSDQLFRARQVGVRRIALTLPTLRPLADSSGALGSEDSQTLVFWARATRERPVELVLASVDVSLSAHVQAIPLGEALRARVETAAARESAPVLPPEPASEPAMATPAVVVVVAPVVVEPVAPVVEPAPVLGKLVAPPPDATDWRTPTLALTAARGPQPLTTLERLFATTYLPLDTLLRDPARVPDPRATHARDEFRDNFSRVYLEAQNAFALTGKRPKMVLDAPETAARIARQTSARTSQILLVDSLRYDLGELVKAELVRLLAQKATLTHELVLWSALPTTTTHQLTTLAQGVSALGATTEEERESGVLRGRTAPTIRRLKIGSRDVYKLDLCDVRVQEAGDRVLPLLPNIASDVATTVAKHASTLAPRTLLFVFGDHGFTLGRDGTASSGGSSPEEVLVPAYAFLVGEAH